MSNSNAVYTLHFATAKDILERLLSGLIEYHPLPWIVDPNWTLEVRDNNNQTVIKIHDQNREQAEMIVSLANSFKEEKNEQTLSEQPDMLPEGYNIEEYGSTLGMGY